MSTVLTGNLQLWPEEGQSWADGQRLWLTGREFDVLLALVREEGHVVGRDQLFEQVWRRPLTRPRDRSVDVHVRRLRLKLAGAAPDWVYIHTHFGLGYRFEPEKTAPMTAPVRRDA